MQFVHFLSVSGIKEYPPYLVIITRKKHWDSQLSYFLPI